MIGPMIPMDDPFPPAGPFPAGTGADDRTAILLWHERQRRQRQVRLLMMFLMMLLLMEGEQQDTSAAGHREHMRRRRGHGHHGGGGQKLGDYHYHRGGGRALEGTVYKARMVQDDKIKRSIKMDGRYGKLNKLNRDTDVEELISDWVRRHPLMLDAAGKRVEEEDLWMRLVEGDGSESGAAAAERDGVDDDGASAAKKKSTSKNRKNNKAFVWKLSADAAGGKVGKDGKDGDGDGVHYEIAKLKVHHYPRNATGFYRGEWKRIGGGKEDSANDSDTGTGDGNGDGDDEEDEKGANKDTSIERKTRRFEGSRLLKNGKDYKKGGSDAAPPPSDDDDDDDDEEDESYDHIVDEAEIEAAVVADIMRSRGDRVGVYVLPRGMRLGRADPFNATRYDNVTMRPSSPTEEAAVAIENAYNNKKKNKLRHGNKRDKDKHTASTAKPRKLSLSQKSGRAAFQLSARSIPAMSQLSLVEGFVKLYDGENTAFSTRRDLLLRVRGIVVHSVGKMSLVANVGRGRSSMIIRTDADADADDADGDDAAKGGGDDGDGDGASALPGSSDDENGSGAGTGGAAAATRTTRAAKKEDGEAESNDKRRHRRLQQSVAELVENSSGASPSSNEVAMDDIRDEVFALFGDADDDLGEVRPLLRDLSEEEGEYDLEDGTAHMRELDSLYDYNDYEGGGDIAADRSFDNLFIGERSRQRFEAISNFFARTPRDSLTSHAGGFLPYRLTSFMRRWLGMEAAEFPIVGVIPISDGDHIDRRRRRLSEVTNTFAMASNRATNNATLEDEEMSELQLLPTTSNRVGASKERRTRVNTALAAAKTKTSTKRTKTTKKRDTTKVDKEALKQMVKNIQTFPFVPDDREHTLEHAKTPIDRLIPYRERLLEENGLQCGFQLNLEIKETELTVGEWRRIIERQVRELEDLDPRAQPDDVVASEDDEDEFASTKKKKRTTSSRAATPSSRKKSSSSRSASSKPEKESLVMSLTGEIVSNECDFSSSINVTAIRTDWEHTTGKAINYSFYMMLTCLTQIVVLLRQLLHTQAQSAATRVSLISIGWQTVLDAILCISHIFLCLVMQPLFTAFASVAFFKLLIFCVIEMKYMAIILQARENVNGNTLGAEEMRRQIALLHLRFYSALMFAMFLFYYAGEKHRTVYMLALYSFWVPQIIQNVITEARRPLHRYYIYGMSITRMVAPLYLYGLPNNFLKEFNPDHPTNLVMCELLVLWVTFQTAILIGQEKYGARFMIPQIFLPPKFDYYRPIPPSLLASAATDAVENANKDQDESSSLPQHSSSPPPASQGLDPPNLAVEGGPLSPPPSGGTSGVARRTKTKAGRRSKSRAGSQIVVKTTIQEAPTDIPTCGGATLDCVICYNDINLSKRKGYMLAPCDHIFHKDCLMQWMDVKMECPICRTELPAT